MGLMATIRQLLAIRTNVVLIVASALGYFYLAGIQTFAIDIVGAERFNTLIGLVFLAIVFSSPDGLLGLWGRLRPLMAQESLRSRLGGGAVLRAQTQSTQGRME